MDSFTVFVSMFDINDIKVGNLIITNEPDTIIGYGTVTKVTNVAFFVTWHGTDEFWDFKSEYPFDITSLEIEENALKANYVTMLIHNRIIQDEKEILAYLIKLN